MKLKEPVADAGRVLLVDDEPALIEAVRYMLRREGFAVSVATSGPAALASARHDAPDVIVLDIMLPGLDGLAVCRELRAESTVPILVLSAKGEEVDRIVGLEVGADDYMTKPFAMRELVARIRAMLRRVRMQAPGAEPQPVAGDGQPPDQPIIAGDLVIDPQRRRVRRGSAEISLKPKEFDLLYQLARQPDVVQRRESLLRTVWGYNVPIDTRTVDVHVRWLRLKLEADPGAPRLIETIRGVGYRFIAASRSDPPADQGEIGNTYRHPSAGRANDFPR